MPADWSDWPPKYRVVPPERGQAQQPFAIKAPSGDGSENPAKDTDKEEKTKEAKTPQWCGIVSQ